MGVIVPPRFLAAYLQDLLGFQAQVQVTCLPSGALDIYVRRGSVVTRVQGRSSWDEFGFTPALEKDAGFDDGHPHVFGTYEELFGALVDSVRPDGASDEWIEELADRVNHTMSLPQFVTGRRPE